jgi:tetratricopeptide (TPR) repeat protein
MKLKPLYIYLIGFALFIAIIIFFSVQQKQSKTPEEAMTGQMPNDDVHKGMGGMGGQKMGALSEAFKKRAADMKAAFDKNPNDTLQMRKYAEFLMEAHKPAESLKLLEQIISKDPKRIDIMLGMTFIYHSQKNLDKAEEITNRILAIDKNNQNASFNLGVIMEDKGNKEKAKQIWNDLIKRFPNTEAAKLSKEALDAQKK